MINQYYILYFFIYAFMGWALEVSVLAIGSHRFVWGTMSLVWIKFGYPRVSGLIEKITPANFLEEYIDENYPDEVVKRNWRNIRFGAYEP